jgi:hypothetical protein
MRNIYDEAIADIKALKQVAADNALASILETLQPKIESFIEEQIFENSLEDDIQEQEQEQEQEKEIEEKEKEEILTDQNNKIDQENPVNVNAEVEISQEDKKEIQQDVENFDKKEEDEDKFKMQFENVQNFVEFALSDFNKDIIIISQTKCIIDNIITNSTKCCIINNDETNAVIYENIKSKKILLSTSPDNNNPKKLALPNKRPVGSP